MKTYLIFFVSIACFVSCDIRRSDKLADDKLVKTEEEKKEIKKNIDAALKESTTVQLIDSVYDFGTVTDGDDVIHSFTFKNTGTKPLVIMDAEASCGCTKPEIPQKPVLPGETGAIKVVFHSKGRLDHQEKTIRVTSNAKPEFTSLKLTGTVAKGQ